MQTYLRERIKEVLTGAGESIVIRIFGPELPVLRQKAEELQQALKDIPGLIDLHVEQQVEVPQIQVKMNLEAAARHGLKPGDVRRVVSALMSGIEVTDIHREGKVYDVWVWSLPSMRHSVESVGEFVDRLTRERGPGELRSQVVPTPTDKARKSYRASTFMRKSKAAIWLGADEARTSRKNAIHDWALPAVSWEYKTSGPQRNLLSSRSALRSRLPILQARS